MTKQPKPQRMWAVYSPNGTVVDVMIAGSRKRAQSYAHFGDEVYLVEVRIVQPKRKRPR